MNDPEPEVHVVRQWNESRHEIGPSASPVAEFPLRGQPRTFPGAVERMRLPNASEALQNDADGHETSFYVVHGVLIAVNILLALALGAVGVRGWMKGRA